MRHLGFDPAPRLKTPTTIIDKLIREKTRLSAMQDIAGVRVVVDGTLNQQDEAVQLALDRFGGTVVDRRSAPTHGYRAVHLITEVDGFRVEIQIRTLLQNLWAQITERVGDVVGRGVRYGVLPDNPARRSAVQALLQMADDLANHEALLARVERLLKEMDALDAAAVADVDEIARVEKEMGALKHQLDARELSFREILEALVAAFERGQPS